MNTSSFCGFSGVMLRRYKHSDGPVSGTLSPNEQIVMNESAWRASLWCGWKNDAGRKNGVPDAEAGLAVG
jgi:hypothetical protein